jgi:hypothetical protein
MWRGAERRDAAKLVRLNVMLSAAVCARSRLNYGADNDLREWPNISYPIFIRAAHGAA